MTHTYQITGMTCSSCEVTVKNGLLSLPEIASAIVSREINAVTITMDKHIPLSELQKAIGGTESKYQIAIKDQGVNSEQAITWFESYKPVLIIFAYLIGCTFVVQLNLDQFDYMMWMRHFMAGFFLVFSFFKLLNLSGFVESYSMYDILAKRFKVWAYIYVFIELGLGLAYLSNFQPLWTNGTALIVMSLSIIGVLQSVLNKRKIQCACLGALFNLPMSTVTLVEDSLMIIMSASMLLNMI